MWHLRTERQALKQTDEPQADMAADVAYAAGALWLTSHLINRFRLVSVQLMHILSAVTGTILEGSTRTPRLRCRPPEEGPSTR